MPEKYSIDDILAELDKKHNLDKKPSDSKDNIAIQSETAVKSDTEKPSEFINKSAPKAESENKPYFLTKPIPKVENENKPEFLTKPTPKVENENKPDFLTSPIPKVENDNKFEFIKKPTPKEKPKNSVKFDKKTKTKDKPKEKTEEFFNNSDNLSQNRENKNEKSAMGFFGKLINSSHSKDSNAPKNQKKSPKKNKSNSHLEKQEKEISTVDFFNKARKEQKPSELPSNTQILDIIGKFEKDELSSANKSKNPVQEIFSPKADIAPPNKNKSSDDETITVDNKISDSHLEDKEDLTAPFVISAEENAEPLQDKSSAKAMDLPTGHPLEKGKHEIQDSKQVKSKVKKNRNILYEKAKPVPKPIIEDISEVEIKTPPKDIAPLKGTDPVFNINDSGVLPLPKGHNVDDTDNIELLDGMYKPPVFEDSPEPLLKTRVETRDKNSPPEKKSLRETELKNTESYESTADLIESLNPYDVRKKAEREVVSDKTVIAFDLSGDTQGIAGGDLKELAEKTPMETGNITPTAEVGVKAYVPAFEKQKETPHIPRSDDNPLIESLNKTINEKIKKRSQGLKASEKQPVLPASNVLNIDYKKQILKDTTLMPSISDPIEVQEKFEELSAKRRRRIKDFVLDERLGDDEEQDDDEDKTSDFDGFDVSGRIWEDLCKSHKWLKIRFLLLLLLTGFLTFIAVANDTGISLGYRIMGFGVFFLDHRYDTFGFLLMNFLLGIFGLGVCSAVVQKGITKLFRGQGDCDSICAVSSLASVFGVIPLFLNIQAVSDGKVHEFVAVGMGALLFNTIGKLLMINRAKHSFRFVFGDNVKYYGDIIRDTDLAGAFTKGAIDELPVLCAVRKTEFLTDFLKSIYCTDLSDKLSKTITPIAFIVSLIIGIIAYLMTGNESGYNLQWAVTAGVGTISAFSAYSIMFLVTNPFRRASKALEKSDSLVLGYNSAVAFADVNSVLIDANSLFPPGSVAFYNIKRCQAKNAINTVAIDEAIITAASLAIKCNSILSSMFYDMIAGKSELLYDVENCIYEVNMGITGWIGNRRIMLGNREQMAHHSIKIPDRQIERKYSTETGDVIYLAISGEAVAMFFIEIIPNTEIKRCLNEFELNGISIAVRTRDSLVTLNKLSDAFDYDPERIKILPFNLHGKFDECTAYSSRGSGGLSCNGTFTSFAAALLAAKKLVKDISFSAATVFANAFFALIFSTVFMLSGRTEVFDPSSLLVYNLSWTAVTLFFQSLRKY